MQSGPRREGGAERGRPWTSSSREPVREFPGDAVQHQRAELGPLGREDKEAIVAHLTRPTSPSFCVWCFDTWGAGGTVLPRAS